MPSSEEESQPLLRSVELNATEVYPVIHMIRTDIIRFIDSALSYDALMAPDLNYTLVRPLHEKYNALQQHGNKSIVLCLLINRVYFLRDQTILSSSISDSRAALCEILAIRALAEYKASVLDLTIILTTSWPVYSGANPSLLAQAREERDGDLEDRVGNAIEMAIHSRAKRFIKSSPCQKVIDAIWSGKCVYQAESSHSILSDTYKRTPVHFYNPHKAPLLDHYRLKVPAIRSVLEYANFLILFILFVVAIEINERDKINAAEGVFMIYALGFTLEKIAAMQEHGIAVYFKGTWNGFDLAFVTTFYIYGVLRIYGVQQDSLTSRTTGIDFLAVIACLMFPRLAFVTLRNNLMVLSLRAMMMQFIALMLIAAFCFGGFLYALWTLSRNEAQYSAGTIAWWMLDLWFGLDASGFDKSADFHPVFGPILIVTYACLSNTLLLTVLVSILSHTFSTINEDAAAEAMFRKAVSTIEGVKADSLFSYQPPVNLIALLIMLPASYILSPRWFHKVNVFMIRLTSFPVLLFIAWYERQAKRSHSTNFYETMASVAESIVDTLPKQLKRITFFEGLAGADADIDAIFEVEQEHGTLRDVPELNSRRLSTVISSRSSSNSNKKPVSITKHDMENPESEQLQQQSPTLSPRPRPVLPHHVNMALLNRIGEISSSPGGVNNHASPLAQIFQPLIVDDENENDLSPAISYGPATRRRLLSMPTSNHRFLTPDAHTNSPRSRSSNPDPNSLSRRFLGPDGTGDRNASPSGMILSTSPDVQGGLALPESVLQVEDEENNEWGPMEFMKHLTKIEERQKRIEDMLVQLTQKSSST